MKIGFLINDFETERPRYTTMRLSQAAINAGHDVWIMDVGGLSYDVDDLIKAHARKVKGKKYKSLDVHLKDLKDPKKHIIERISIDQLDVLMLRNDPASEQSNRAWARNVGINFGRIATKHGVIVLNDPNGLSKASNKLYSQEFPEELRPKTLITRNREEIKAFAKKFEKIVVKPISGSGGQNVFLLEKTDISNINQIIDTVSRAGYVIAQEYVPEAAEGDTRLFLVNGVPLKHRGKYAAARRIRSPDDLRSNIHAGGTIAPATVTPEMLKIAEMVRPKLVQDGMFFVGLDIVGTKILEINVFTPGGLGTASKLEGLNFTKVVLNAIERKVNYMQYYKRKFNNVELATL
ncbi:glutathione synthase [archaeon]|jgi:glutathione synthase|nr:glutathione synthase [archaeon]MBT4022422.1 glutathione synthase [archaeon]MBT4272576.1 glutathione synthase [archaeon]MBT4461257.1 glutathione synthase [archaeon]MBT4858553.1 glutathione synthase [archaeon]